MTIVYKHTNRVTNKSYVGWTSKTIDERWAAHLRAVSEGSSTMFHNSIRSHGSDVWDHEILEECSSHEDAKNAEKKWIALLETYAFDFPDKGYNMTRGGDGLSGEAVSNSNRRRGCVFKTRFLMSRKRLGKSQSQKHSKTVKHSFQHEQRRLLVCRLFHKRAQIRKENQHRLKTEQQIILIVGPDRCGKSNIAQALSERINVKVFKASSEHHAFLNDQTKFINDLRIADPRVCDFVFQTRVSVIFDRGFPCERVYSEFFNRETDLTVLRKLDEQYARMNAKIIFCTRKSFEGIVDDLDSKLDSNALQMISELYKAFLLTSKCSSLTLFVDDENLDREVTEIIRFLEGTE